VTDAVLKLQVVYLDRGMLLAKLDEPELDVAEDGAVTVTFAVVEGDVYRLKTIRFENLANELVGELLPKMKSRPRQVFNRSRLMADIEILTETLKARGMDVEFSLRTDIDQVTKTVELVFDVKDLAAH
jgi:outer membrane protein assembly factor BamA